METLKIPNPPQHNFRVIAVPDKLIAGRQITDVKTLEDDAGRKYDVVEWWSVYNTISFPHSFMQLATGKRIDPQVIFSKKCDEKIYFILVHERK